MSVEEFWLEFDMHSEAQERVEEARGGITKKHWAQVRKLHKEKMKGNGT